MSTTATLPTESVSTDARIDELRQELRQAEGALDLARTALADGTGLVADVTEAEARVNAFRGAMETLQERRRQQAGAEMARTEEGRLEALLTEYRDTGLLASELIHQFAEDAQRMRATVVRLEAATELHDRAGLALIQLRQLPKDVTGDEVPEETWRSFGRLVFSYREMVPTMMAIEADPPTT